MSRNNDGVAEALAAIGMRMTSGPGWYVKVRVDDEVVSVWATDVIDDDDDRDDDR